MEERQPIKIDRRRGPDLVMKSIRWAIFACWLMIFVVWAYVYYAMPEQLTIFDPHGLYKQPRTYWDMTMLKYAFIAINIMLLISLGGLTISSMRQKRKSDKSPKTLILMIVMSLIGMLIIYFKF
ncbi:MAG: hypothetical protein L7F77_09770 [Candidatus Magnetominusculus sp. LBB02]|nr:hypothetical protein [Candidatus Magnetominusculus sp. LBB02]